MTDVSLDWSLGQTYISCVKTWGAQSSYFSLIPPAVVYMSVCVCHNMRTILERYSADLFKYELWVMSWLASSDLRKWLIIPMEGGESQFNTAKQQLLLHDIPPNIWLLASLWLHKYEFAISEQQPSLSLKLERAPPRSLAAAVRVSGRFQVNK